jgi:phosphate transport system protein
MVTTSSEHIVTSYEDELTEIVRLISEMGGMVEQAVTNSVTALVTLDHALAKKVVEGDEQVDELERRIDDMGVSMIARRQPMGPDLRQIIASIHVATDLERIGDMAKNIGRRTLQISEQHVTPQLYKGVRHMSELALGQVNRAISSFTSRDTELAVDVCKRDDEVDAIYMSLFREFLTYMMEDPRNITDCMHLLFCAKHLERTGDHATNIAEAAFYMVSGKNLPLALERDDV